MKRKKFSTESFLFRRDKPWGWELIFSPPSAGVTGKILHLKAGCRFSLQYHDEKEEVLVLLRGKAKIILENEEGELEEKVMEKGRGYWIQPGQKHRCQAVTDCEILEASTPERGNTYRLEDDYSRGIEREEERFKEDKKE